LKKSLRVVAGGCRSHFYSQGVDELAAAAEGKGNEQGRLSE
jgi:hypothetical protein